MSVATITTTVSVATTTKSLDIEGTELQSLVAELATLRKAIKEQEDQEKALKDKIVEQLGEAEEGTIAGLTVVKVSDRTRTSYDTKTLEASYPEIAEALRKESTYQVVTIAK